MRHVIALALVVMLFSPPDAPQQYATISKCTDAMRAMFKGKMRNKLVGSSCRDANNPVLDLYGSTILREGILLDTPAPAPAPVQMPEPEADPVDYTTQGNV